MINMFGRLLRKKSFYRRDISRLKREIKAVSGEIKDLETKLGEIEKTSLPPERNPSLSSLRGRRGKVPADSESRKRFASYLSTGSFQTIREYKFKSDFVRRRRLIWGILLFTLLVLIILLWRIL